MKFEPLSLTAPRAGAPAVAAQTSAARFTLEHALFAGKTFLAAFRICGNPCCPCGVIGFLCQIEGAPEQTIRFDLDVFERRLNTKVQRAPEGVALGHAFIAETQPEDWQWLGNLFLASKRHQMETMELDTLDAYLPGEVMAGDGTMVGYAEIFPWAEMFEFTLDGQRWVVDDQYCVRPGCACAETVLSFFCLSDAGRPSPKRRRCLIALFYDYRAGTFKVEQVRRGSPPPDLLVPALRAAHSGLTVNLARRHGQLKQISRRLWPKSGLRSEEVSSFLPADGPVANESRPSASAISSPPRAKVGRNDPCPCGSGKKYKKCCGR